MLNIHASTSKFVKGIIVLCHKRQINLYKLHTDDIGLCQTKTLAPLQLYRDTQIKLI